MCKVSQTTEGECVGDNNFALLSVALRQSERPNKRGAKAASRLSLSLAVFLLGFILSLLSTNTFLKRKAIVNSYK
jgi:hypothetical protein